jgi:hypothetical protein
MISVLTYCRAPYQGCAVKNRFIYCGKALGVQTGQPNGDAIKFTQHFLPD